jgi:hypothetical protein
MGWESAVEAFDDGVFTGSTPGNYFSPLSLASAIDIAQFDVPCLWRFPPKSYRTRVPE